MAFANDAEKFTFKVKGYTYRVIQDDKVELVEIPQKFKQSKQSDCLIDLTPIIRHKKQYYELVSIPDKVFSDIHRDNRMVLRLPSTVKHIGVNNQIHDLYYDIILYNNWMDADCTILLGKDGKSVVWVNKTKSHKFKQIPLPAKVKTLPSWFWGCFPNLQLVTLTEELDEDAIKQLFDGCTPFLRGKNLFLVQSDKTGEVVWKSSMCSHVTILDYPRVWDAAQRTIVKEHFAGLEICLVDGCEYPCIYMDGIPYNSVDGEPAIALPSKRQNATNDTLSLSVNQFSLTTPKFIAAHAPKHIDVVNNTKGDIRFDREILQYASMLTRETNVTTSLSRIARCYVNDVSTPYKNYDGNLYNPTTGDLFVLTKQDTIEVRMKDENRLAMHNYIEQLVAAQAVKHVEYVVANVDSLSDVEARDMTKILATGVSASPLGLLDSEIFLVVEDQPEFPGGMRALMQFLRLNMQYPTICQEQGIQGRVVVSFVVNTDGSIVDAKVVNPVNPHLDKEALRVISMMPPWKPGTQRGKAVRVRFTLPVTFRLSLK